MSTLLVYLFNILLLAGFVWWLFRQKWAQALRPYLYPALGVKLLVALGFAALRYSYYQTGDTHVFHNAGLTLLEYARHNPEGYLRLLLFNQFGSEGLENSLPFTEHAYFSNSFFFIKVVSLLNLATGGAYYLNNLYLSLFSFWGSAYLAAKLGEVLPKHRLAAVIAFLFFPSVLFWSSGVMKDPVMYGSMCWLTGAALALAHGQKPGLGHALLLPLQLYLFIRIKVFYAALLLPLLLAYVLVQRLKAHVHVLRSLKAQLLLLLALAGGAVLLLVLQKDTFNPDFILWNIENSYSSLFRRSPDRPHIDLGVLRPTLPSMAANYPEAALSAVYRPFLGESWEPLYVLSSLENLLLLVLSGVALAAVLRRGAGGKVRLLHVIMLVFVLLMAGVTGLSTPNFGTLSRYRIVFLPFLVYLLLQNAYAQRLLQRLRPRRTRF